MNARIAQKMLSKERVGRYAVSQLKRAVQVMARIHKREMERDIAAYADFEQRLDEYLHSWW